MAMMMKKRCRRKPEKLTTQHLDDMPRYGQTPKMTQYISTQTEKCLRVRIQKIIIGGQTEIPIDRIDTVAYTMKEISGYEKFVVLQVKIGTEKKEHQSQYRGTYKSLKISFQAT